MATKTVDQPAVAGARGIPLTEDDLDEEELGMLRCVRSFAAGIARDASTMESSAAEQFIAGQVFEIVERVADEISQGFAMAVARYLTSAIRRRLTH